MPDTPAIWLNDFVVNLTTFGAQSNPRITHLANGNILVVWDSNNDSGEGFPDGLDILGQLFDPLGQRIGVEFRVNASSVNNDEQDPDIAALPSGRFVSVYEEETATGQSIRLTRREADGTISANLAVQADTSANADETYFDPRVAVSSNTSALVVYMVENAGDAGSRIAGRIYNSEAHSIGPEITLISIPGRNDAPSVAVLTNGNYVIAAETVTTAGDQVISYRIVDATGASVLTPVQLGSTIGDSENDRDAEVTALTGGGFVITWTNTDASDTDVLAQRFDENGVAQGGQINVSQDFGDNDNESVTVALQDGGFLVIFDDDSATPGLRGRRYDAAGAAVGDEFTIATGLGAGDPDAELLDDGRVAVTFRDAAGEIRMEILDVRDAANATGVYGPPDWQIGTVGDDTITSDGNVFFVAGHDGDDVINTGGPAATYLGGAGNDTVNVIDAFDPGDVYDGGAGIDTIDFTRSFPGGGVFDLGAGTATVGEDVYVMAGFETLVGTAGDDVMNGRGSTTETERLEGGEGNDTINGLGDGVSLLFGGNGEDQIIGGPNPGSRLFGGDDNDTLTGTQITLSTDRLFGGEGDDVLFHSGRYAEVQGDAGNDTLHVGGRPQGTGNIENGGQFGGADDDRFIAVAAGFVGSIFGGTGIDTLDLSGVTAANTFAIDLLAGSYDETGEAPFIGIITQSLSLEDVEHVIGSARGDVILGSTTANILTGNGGDDRLEGGDGTDELFGGTGRDTLRGGADGDILNGGAEDDQLEGGAGDDDLTGSDGDDTLDGGDDNDSLFGGLGFDSLAGGDGDDSLDGGGDDDELFGGAGSDTLLGGAGFDTVTGGTGDTVDGGADDDTIIVDGAGGLFSGGAGADIILFSGDAFVNTFDYVFDMTTGAVNAAGESYTQFESARMGAGDDSVTGTIDSNVIEGGDGNDTLRGAGGGDGLFGAEGNDSLFGDAGNDFLHGEAGNDSLSGGADDDDLEGGDDDDTLSGDAGNDALLGGDGNDRLFGGADNDNLFGDDGDDTLDGGTGNDTMQGGAGNDTYIVDSIGDRVVEADFGFLIVTDPGGIDTVRSAITFSLAVTGTVFPDADARFVENLILTGTGNTNGTGNGLANQITGNSGNNRLDGGTGSDTLTGGTGSDTLTGGGGTDLAVYSGAWANYRITEGPAGTFTLVDTRAGAPDGTDVVSGVESFQFANGTFTAAQLLNDAPVAVNDSNGADAVVEAGGTANAVAGDPTATGNVLTNDTDADTPLGDTLRITAARAGTEAPGGTLSAVQVSPVTLNGIFGSLLLNPNGSYTYTLNNADPDTQALAAGAGATDAFTYRVSDARGQTDLAQLVITVTGANDAPAITSNGGGATAAVSVAENTTAVTTVTASDPDAGATRSFAIVGGADAARFTINATTGTLRFASAPNFEASTDAGANNVYNVRVRVSDGTLTDVQSIAVTVRNADGRSITGTGGNDTITTAGSSGGLRRPTDDADTLIGLGGNDSLEAGAGKDLLVGGAGKDTLDGGTGSDTMIGGAGNDTYVVNSATDRVFETTTIAGTVDAGGNDTVRSAVSFSLDASAGVRFVETLVLAGGMDTSGSGNALANRISGNSGNNALVGRAGDDTLSGGNGRDVLTGGPGLDLLFGGRGADTLDGGQGNDTLFGGDGKDAFVFSTAPVDGAGDRIADFSVIDDTIRLSGGVFAGLPTGRLAASAFAANLTGAASDGRDRIIYETDTGRLYFDADGSGAGARVHFATLTADLALSGGDFFVF